MSDLEHTLYMDMEKGVDRFPFVEDENCNITGYGHQDKSTFVAEINRYDEYCIGEPLTESEQFKESDITWKWVIVDKTTDTFVVVPETHYSAFPVTTLWNKR